MAKSLQQVFLYYIPQLRESSKKFQKRKDLLYKEIPTIKGAVDHSFHV